MELLGIDTPILFLIFNRPDTTKIVFEQIKKIRPKRLFVAADGPRIDKAGEFETCMQTRKIIEQIDWSCELKTLFRDENLGCKRAVSSAIDWFFEHVEEGIILEDDCFPHECFFRFCKTMLDKYRDNPQIMHISGDNFQKGINRGDGSYYFTKYVHVWGWASWKRAWSHYDVCMSRFPEYKKNNLIKNVFDDINIQNNWIGTFDNVYNNKVDTWDYQWCFSIWCQNGLAICPNQNLVSNIGFHPEATHTKDVNSLYSNMDIMDIGKIIDSTQVIRNLEADLYTFYSSSPKPREGFWRRISKKLRYS
jgi:hypothetical protein